jgi:hypothetical protein
MLFRTLNTSLIWFFLIFYYCFFIKSFRKVLTPRQLFAENPNYIEDVFVHKKLLKIFGFLEDYLKELLNFLNDLIL